MGEKKERNKTISRRGFLGLSTAAGIGLYAKIAWEPMQQMGTIFDELSGIIKNTDKKQAEKEIEKYFTLKKQSETLKEEKEKAIEQEERFKSHYNQNNTFKEEVKRRIRKGEFSSDALNEFSKATLPELEETWHYKTKRFIYNNMQRLTGNNTHMKEYPENYAAIRKKQQKLDQIIGSYEQDIEKGRIQEETIENYISAIDAKLALQEYIQKNNIDETLAKKADSIYTNLEEQVGERELEKTIRRYERENNTFETTLPLIGAAAAAYVGYKAGNIASPTIESIAGRMTKEKKEEKE